MQMDTQMYKVGISCAISIALQRFFCNIGGRKWLLSPVQRLNSVLNFTGKNTRVFRKWCVNTEETNFKSIEVRLSVE